jgi:hypothetical protein
MAAGTLGPALAQMAMMLLYNDIILKINLLETCANAGIREAAVVGRD